MFKDDDQWGRFERECKRLGIALGVMAIGLIVLAVVAVMS